MNEDSSTAQQDNTAPVVNEYQNPNDLDFEMSAEEEQAFINETLGLNNESKSDSDKQDNVDNDDKPGEPSKEPEAPEEQEVKESEPEKPTEPETPTEVKTEEPKPTEPAEIKTDDLWVEVEKVTVDEDGKQTVEKVKLVFDPNDPSTFIPDDFRFKNDKQLADILEAKAEMAALYKERSAERETEIKAQEATKSAEQQKADQLAGWDAEIQDLIDSGIIAAPKAKVGDKDFLEDESVKKIDAVFKFMAEKNDERAKENKPAIRSFGTAFSMYENDAKVKAEAEAEAKSNADAKTKGALVGGSSAASTGGGKPYVAGSASSIWEIPIND